MKVQHFYQQLLRLVTPRPPCMLLLPGARVVAHLWCSVPSSDAAWAPLDLPSLVAEHLPGRQERVFWKLVLVLPDGEEQSPGSPGRSGRSPPVGLDAQQAAGRRGDFSRASGS